MVARLLRLKEEEEIMVEGKVGKAEIRVFWSGERLAHSLTFTFSVREEQ